MKHLFIKTSLGIILTAVFGIILCVSILVYFSLDLPDITHLENYKPPVESKILARDGTVLAEMGIEKRDVVQVDDVPPIILEAFLAAEDSKFYEHEGINYLGIFRAFLANLKAGRVIQGGSTITQQVAKSLLLSSERALSRKIKDFLLAYKIEQRFTKKEILFLYINQVYLGGGYYGIRAAFKGYFDKELSETTIAEAAMIAGLLAAPGRYSPYINPKKAKVRQSYVLGRLYKTGRINLVEYQQALKENMKFHIRKPPKFLAKYFTDWIRQRVINEVGKESFLRDGFKIHTTLDYKLQAVAEVEVENGIREMDKRQGFRTPKESLGDKQEIIDYNIQKRVEVYKKQSSFFTLGEGYSPVYEIEYDPTEYEKINQHKENFYEEVGSTQHIPGYYRKDRFLQYIEQGEFYDAVVTNTDDNDRIIYVDIMGITGIIPYDDFKWARERDISEERKFHPNVTKPSTILSPGDKILVKVNQKATQLIPNVLTVNKDNYNSIPKEILKEIKKQRYLLCSLEQDVEAEGALVSINPHTGEIISFVGGVDFNKSQFNRVIQSKRQPGSSFKPLLFAAALEDGFTPNTVIIDSPEALGGVDSSLNWKPRNYDGKFKGPITFRNVLEQSRNIPSIKIARKLGVSRVTEFIKRVGLDTELRNDLSFSLGSFGVTLMNLVATYGIFPSGGKKVIPKAIISIVDRDGNVYSLQGERTEDEIEVSNETIASSEPSDKEYLDVPESENLELEEEETEEDHQNRFQVSLDENQVYDPRLAYIMTNLLSGVIRNGTGRSASKISPFIAGKTGTTNNYVDTWFLGFSSNLVTGVWTGFDNNKTLGWGETGAKSALPIWKKFMGVAIKEYGDKSFSVPSDIINVKINKDTGSISNLPDENDFTEAFVQGTEPTLDNVVDLSSTDNETPSSGQIIEEDDYYNSQ